MFLKHLINPKPTIILFFVVFCVVFISIPLINYDFNTIFINGNTSSYLVFFLGLTLPFFQGLGLNNLIYEKNIIKKDNLVIGFVFILLGSSFYNTVDAWISSFIMLFFFNFIMDSYQKDYPFSEYFNAVTFSDKDVEQIHDLMIYDKKNEGDKVNFVLMKNIGTPVVDQQITKELFIESFRFYSKSL